MLDGIRAWNGITLCFGQPCAYVFRLLRAGEAVAPDNSDFDPTQHLTYADIAVDNASKPIYLQVNIKQSKTDPFRLGVKIIVGRAGNELCPVAAILSYMALRGPGSGPLFRFKNGRPLTRSSFVSKLREALEAVGVDCSGYSGHSFRIGAATTAASKGIQDSLIKTAEHCLSTARKDSTSVAYISSSHTSRIIRDIRTMITKANFKIKTYLYV